MNPIRFKSIIAILVLLIAHTVKSQSPAVIEIEADHAELTSDPDLKQFYSKFNLWVKSVQEKTPIPQPPKESMVNNFIIFSEDGLIMKDLDFHTVEACKESIVNNLPEKAIKTNVVPWIYVSLESHVSRNDLREILIFLRENKIEYYFGTDVKIAELIKR